MVIIVYTNMSHKYLQTGKKRKQQNLCPRCAIQWTGTTYYCTLCTEYHKNRKRQSRKNSEGLCSSCLIKDPLPNLKYCEICHERNKNASKKMTQKYRKIVINAYGGKCNCCNNTNPRILQLDHINNDGKFHRKQINTTMYKWAIKNKFPLNLQLLCANCHMIKTIYGKCLPTDHLT